jgi:predicted nucleotidyltransferase
MDPQVEKVVNRISQTLKPEKVFLFGSRVQGVITKDSDIDLVVIYSGPKSRREVLLDIHRLFKHPDFSLDVFVMTPLDFETQKRIPNTLAREVSERGVVCYG